MASTSGSGRSAQELAVYLYYVVLHMFEAKAPGRIRPIKVVKVVRQASQNETTLEKPEFAHEGFLTRAAEVAGAKQPFVLRYIVEALFEPTEGERPESLTEEEQGLVFLTLETVIDLLDEAVPRSRGPTRRCQLTSHKRGSIDPWQRLASDVCASIELRRHCGSQL